ncbi:hypothetical protein IFR05_003652 [Cadophora sp. M221]|nr:hypothetical protein IFR05_003652 [Cadophora sp. M221]
MFRKSQVDSESNGGQSPTTHSFGMHHRAFDRPPLKTPFRPQWATAPSTSSSSSSSTTSSLFDKGLMTTGTPLTSPISKTADLSNAARLGFSSDGQLSPSSFVERCLDASNTLSATPASAKSSTAKPKLTSHYVSISDYEFLVEGVKNLSVEDDEQVSSTRGSLGLDESPARAGRSQLKNESHQRVQGYNEYSQLPIKYGVSNRKHKHRNTSGTEEALSAEPTAQQFLSLAGARNTPQSSERNNAKIPSLLITQIDYEVTEVDADSTSTISRNLPPVQYRQKVTLSAPRASHKRSASASASHTINNTIVQDTPIDSTSAKSTSPTQRYEVVATARPTPTRCSSRRHSTGSVVAEYSSLPLIGFSSPRTDEPAPGASANECISFSEVGLQNSSSKPLAELPQRTPDLHPNEMPKSPILVHMHLEKKNENDLKNEILRLIRRQKSKPASPSTLIHGYVYIFKSDEYPGHVKIGSTVKAPETRKKEWVKSCKFEAIQVTDKNDTAFRFCRMVEQIVHAELYNERRKFCCVRCKKQHRFTMAEREKGTGETELDVRPTEHGEWFEISETKALEVVNKWRNWMIHQEPYKDDTTLRSCWVWKYDMGTKWLKGTEAEWEVWRQFGRLDKLRYLLYELIKWLGIVLPLLQKLVGTPASVFVLSSFIYLGSFGVNWIHWVQVLSFLSLYVFVCFKFC